MTVITVEDLKVALSKTVGKKGTTEEEIIKIAEHVLSFFGFRGVIIDNKLRAKDRDLFYKLENERLLRTDSEEVTLKKGKRWRIHYWILNKPVILKLSRGVEEKEEKNEYDIYEIDEIWARENLDES